MEHYKGMMQALQQLSKSLTKQQQSIIKETNRQALEGITKSLSVELPRIKMVGLENNGHLNSFLQNEKLADAIRRQKYLMGELAIGKSYSDTIKEAFSQLQIPALISLKTALQTDMVKALTNSLVDCNFSAVANITKELFLNDSIAASDFAVLKTTRLVPMLKDDVDIPRGLLTSIKNLNNSPALYLSTRRGVEYSINRSKFTALNDNGNEVIVSASEMNVICEGANLINGEDEFITEIELMDFLNALFETPNFAARHPSAIKIERKIRELFDRRESGLICKINDVTEYYHARPLDEGRVPYVFQEMKKAPVGISGPGRYNHPGQAYYYFCDTIEGAESEIKKHHRNRMIQTVVLKPKIDGVLLDLSRKMRGGAVFLKYIRFPKTGDDDKRPREYLIPTFVGECCRNVGFDGIKYYGGKHYNNYVTWEDHHFEVDCNV